MSSHARTASKRAEAAFPFTPVRNRLLQRKCACGGAAGISGQCEECGGEKLLRRHAAGHALAAVPPIVHEVLRSPGQPLDASTRDFMEPRFGHDFSHVRVHADTRAAESTRAVNAHAYTVGQHIAIADATFDPRSQAGRRLLAHELTHVVQQANQASSAADITIGAASDPFEIEAEHAADQMMSSSPIHLQGLQLKGATLQRDEAKKARIDVAIVLDDDSYSEAGAYASTVLRVYDIEDAKKKLKALGSPIGTLFVLSHATSEGEVKFESNIGTLSWVKISDLGKGLKGALSADQAPNTIDFQGCKVGEAGGEVESFRQALGAGEAKATNCWTFTQHASPITVDGVDITQPSQVPEKFQSTFDQNLLKQVNSMVSANGHKVKDCLVGLAPNEKATEKNLNKIKELYFKNKGVLIASWASPDYNENWQKGSICSKDMTSSTKPCGIVRKSKSGT